MNIYRLLIIIVSSVLLCLFIYGCSNTGGGYFVSTSKGPNTAPVAFADEAFTEVNTPIVIQVLANDTDRNGDQLMVTALSPVTGGEALIQAGGSLIEVTPSPGSTQAVTFEYTISDGNGGTSTASVTVNISGCVSGMPPDQSIFASGIELIQIKSGCFIMGSADNEEDRNTYEGPVHQVTISKDFYLGKYEITQAQWKTVMGGADPWPGSTVEEPSAKFGLADNNPAYFVSWLDITEVGGFLDKLNQLTGCDLSALSTDEARYHPAEVPSGCFRLPTEAEWEYAARAGTTTRFSFGDDSGYVQLVDHAWYAGNSKAKGEFDPDYGTHSVGQKLANPWGLHDMYGNVAEWTYDNFGSYTAASQTDPAGPSTGFRRVMRGGNWAFDAELLRSAYRSFVALIDDRNDGLGFRVVKVL